MQKQAVYHMDGAKVIIHLDTDTVEIVDENTSKTLAAVPFLEWVEMCSDVSNWSEEEDDDTEQMDLFEWAKSLEDKC